MSFNEFIPSYLKQYTILGKKNKINDSNKIWVIVSKDPISVQEYVPDSLPIGHTSYSWINRNDNIPIGHTNYSSGKK